MQQQVELVMQPEVNERIAVAEEQIRGIQRDVSRILQLVEIMPKRMEKRVNRLLENCRATQAETYGLKRTTMTQAPAQDRDWGQLLRNIVIVAGIIGGLLGGAYQASVGGTDRPAITQQQAGGSK